MLTSIKAKIVTQKYAWLLKISILASDQERTIDIVSKFEYTQCIGCRPVKLKTISRWISSDFSVVMLAWCGPCLWQREERHLSICNIQLLEPDNVIMTLSY